MLQFILFIIVISHILQYVITEFDIHEHTEYIYTGNYTSRNVTNKNIKLLFGLLILLWNVKSRVRHMLECWRKFFSQVSDNFIVTSSASSQSDLVRITHKYIWSLNYKRILFSLSWNHQKLFMRAILKKCELHPNSMIVFSPWDSEGASTGFK